MSNIDLINLAPFIILALAPVIIMLLLTISRNLKIIYGFSLFMIAAAFVALFFQKTVASDFIGSLIIIDNFGITFMSIIFLAGIIIAALSYQYLVHHSEQKEEYFIILFISILGTAILVTAGHFITFFLGLETLSISLYILIAYLKQRNYSIEASIKFLVNASVATAFLLFGMAFIYAETGTMIFSELTFHFASNNLSVILIVGFIMMMVGIGFKMALVPFHMWAPDVYQGAPAPVTALIATISKGAILALALRFVITLKAYENGLLVLVITIIAVLSMFVGNFLALNQPNFKRLMAYSSIAHMGYLLITLVAGTTDSIQAAVFYIISYMVTTLGIFGVISMTSLQGHDLDRIEDFRGLFRKNPWLAFVLSLCLFSLAGIPLTAGFIAKFYLVLAGVKAHLWILAVSLIINTVISVFFYLRTIKTMFTVSEPESPFVIPFSGHLILIFVTVVILVLGILPSLLTKFLNNLLI